MPRLRVTVDRRGRAVRGARFGISLRGIVHPRTAVAEVPRLVADWRAKRPHFERQRIAASDSECWSIGGVDGGRELVLLILVEDLHRREIVVDSCVGVRHLEDFAVTPGLLISALDLRSLRRAAVAKGPIVAGDLAVSAPGPRAVQGGLPARRDQMVRSGDGNKLRLMLADVRLP